MIVILYIIGICGSILNIITFHHKQIRPNSYPLTNTTRCTSQIGSLATFIIIDGFFFSLYKGAIVPFLLCTFALLIDYNMQRSRRRATNHQIPRTNRTMTVRISSIVPIAIVIQN
ncbi:unnamed protein product [Rotaria socialis]|uniref:Uncharacterized protein n=1 Tax=Rotaria socialis TaxID=392032 RepID=A0A820LFV3_9BILA|nr:unnamed protein product [Rotaria socialis]